MVEGFRPVDSVWKVGSSVDACAYTKEHIIYLSEIRIILYDNEKLCYISE